MLHFFLMQIQKYTSTDGMERASWWQCVCCHVCDAVVVPEEEPHNRWLLSAFCGSLHSAAEAGCGVGVGGWGDVKADGARLILLEFSDIRIAYAIPSSASPHECTQIKLIVFSPWGLSSTYSWKLVALARMWCLLNCMHNLFIWDALHCSFMHKWWK